jgi:hypothetical protein
MAEITAKVAKQRRRLTHRSGPLDRHAGVHQPERNHHPGSKAGWAIAASDAKV